MPRNESSKALAVVLHDVAPQTWPLYRTFVDELDALGEIPLTLLVVPDFHHRGLPDADPLFRSAIDARLERGDEVVLHGYSHSDDRPLGFNPFDRFMRRVYTCEGEFYSLSRDEASLRIAQGLEVFTRLHWPVTGFVAPAWLMNHAAREALTSFPFGYTSSPEALIELPQWRSLPAPSLVWSVRSAWRRGVSRAWNDRRLRHGRDLPLIRLGLHPVDLRHAEVRRYWRDMIEALCAERDPVTKGEWIMVHGAAVPA